MHRQRKRQRKRLFDVYTDRVRTRSHVTLVYVWTNDVEKIDKDSR